MQYWEITLSLRIVTPGIEGQGQLGIKVITHVVPSNNIPEWRSVQQVEYGT